MTNDVRQRTKTVIGLIGGIGSGKSSVAAEFAKRGARVLCGDEFGHEALRRPDIKEQVTQRWGPEILKDGEVDRRKLAQVVFADPVERRALEALVFPWITRRLDEEVAAAKADPGVPFIVVDAAVMLEAGWNNVCDRIVYVDAPRELRLARLAQQRGWTEKEVTAREQAQLPANEKMKRADHVLDNSGTPEETARQIDYLLRLWGLTRGTS